MHNIVWIPKHRYKVLVDEVDEYLKIKIDEAMKKYPEMENLERNIRTDHIHLIVRFPSKYSIANVV